jgi:hypothetical protein
MNTGSMSVYGMSGICATNTSAVCESRYRISGASVGQPTELIEEEAQRILPARELLRPRP